jgi:hypothetical protein
MHCGLLLCDGGVQVGYIVVNVYKTTHSDDDKELTAAGGEHVREGRGSERG